MELCKKWIWNGDWREEKGSYLDDVFCSVIATMGLGLTVLSLWRPPWALSPRHWPCLTHFFSYTTCSLISAQTLKTGFKFGELAAWPPQRAFENWPSSNWIFIIYFFIFILFNLSSWNDENTHISKNRKIKRKTKSQNGLFETTPKVLRFLRAPKTHLSSSCSSRRFVSSTGVVVSNRLP